MSEADFSDWAEGFPMDSDLLDDCALMNGDHGWKWTDADCSKTLATAMCQMGDPGAPNPTTTTTSDPGPGPTDPTGTTPGTTTTNGGGGDTPASERLELVGGSDGKEGNVWATNSNGVFGVVCDDGWNQNSADVVCKQLGYSGAADVFDHSNFGDVNSDDFSFDEISCTGSEAHIQDCTYDLEEDCHGGEAAGVRCA